MIQHEWQLTTVPIVNHNGTVSHKEKTVFINKINFFEHCYRFSLRFIKFYWIGIRPRALVENRVTGEQYLITPQWKPLNQKDIKSWHEN